MIGRSSRLAESGKPEALAEVIRTLAAWKANPDLAGVRDPGVIAKLPDEEQKAWRDLWAEVNARETKAAGVRRGP